MPLIRFVNPTHDVTVSVADTLYILKPEHDDPKVEAYGDVFQGARNGVGKCGECIVEVEDQSLYSRTLAVLQALKSPVGIGDYTVYIAGTAQSYCALIDIDVESDGAQFVKIIWNGSLYTVED